MKRKTYEVQFKSKTIHAESFEEAEDLAMSELHEIESIQRLT